jgi:hypothetical protein
MAKKKCKVCGDPTNVIFNIAFKAVHICEGCANAIALQQVSDLVKQSQEKQKK